MASYPRTRCGNIDRRVKTMSRSAIFIEVHTASYACACRMLYVELLSWENDEGVKSTQDRDQSSRGASSHLLGWVRCSNVYQSVLHATVCRLNLEFGEANSAVSELPCYPGRRHARRRKIQSLTVGRLCPIAVSKQNIVVSNKHN